ncbi:MAG: hypothetical protein OXE50_06265 [Chloroflexi bacterium]|nr:hypothetical protein [Chloroflexota bacterium]
METTQQEALRERLEKEAAEIVREFEGRVLPEEVHRTFYASVERFSDARIKEFIPLFAGIATRQVLRSGE